MYSETYKIAEHNIRICSLYDEVHTLCKDYQHNEYTDFTAIPTATLKPWLCTEKYAKS